jgi:hypothetical protein
MSPRLLPDHSIPVLCCTALFSTGISLNQAKHLLISSILDNFTELPYASLVIATKQSNFAALTV